MITLVLKKQCPLELVLYSQAKGNLLHNLFQFPQNAIYFITLSLSVQVIRPS